MGNNIIKLRGKHGMLQSELAERVGITRQAMNLNELKKVSVPVAIKVAEVLGENLFDVLGTDVLRVLPTTKQDKKTLIEIIKKI